MPICIIEYFLVHVNRFKRFFSHKIGGDSLIYDTVNAICERKGVTVWKLEKELGFSNGCIRKWNKSVPGIDKLQKVANYLGVSIEELLREA